MAIKYKVVASSSQPMTSRNSADEVARDLSGNSLQEDSPTVKSHPDTEYSHSSYSNTDDQQNVGDILRTV